MHLACRGSCRNPLAARVCPAARRLGRGHCSRWPRCDFDARLELAQRHPPGPGDAWHGRLGRARAPGGRANLETYTGDRDVGLGRIRVGHPRVGGRRVSGQAIYRRRSVSGASICQGWTAASEPMVRNRRPEPLDPRTFAPTGFAVNNAAFWNFFQQHGGVQTFGYRFDSAEWWCHWRPSRLALICLSWPAAWPEPR
jgi:hypothetical protein